MKPPGGLRHFAVAFLLALVGYVVCYQAIEYRRTWKGPWQVIFTRTTNDEPAILINQPRLAITNVQICFTGARLPPPARSIPVRFAQPRPVPYDLPYGQCIFMDSTFLPGTLTLQLYGHEIELLPRVLVIDRQEHPWRQGATIVLPGG